MSSSRALCCLPSEQGQAKVQHKPPILDDDLKKLYESGVFNSDHSKTLLNKMFFEIMLCFCRHGRQNLRQLKKDDFTGAPNGSVPQNICSIGTFLLAGRCGRNNSPWKESVAGKKIIQGARGNLKSRIAAAGYLYGLLTTQDLNSAL